MGTYEGMGTYERGAFYEGTIGQVNPRRYEGMGTYERGTTYEWLGDVHVVDFAATLDAGNTQLDANAQRLLGAKANITIFVYLQGGVVTVRSLQATIAAVSEVVAHLVRVTSAQGLVTARSWVSDNPEVGTRAGHADVLETRVTED